ncbi:unnamed protein product, partial [Rotaria magnacalcarata]
EEFDKVDLNESTSLINELVIATDIRKSRLKHRTKEKSLKAPLISSNTGTSPSPMLTNKTA